MPKSRVQFADTVEEYTNRRVVPRPRQKPIPNVPADSLHRYQRSIYYEDAMYNKYARDMKSVYPQYQKLYPPFHIWKSFRQYGEARGIDYRKGNVEDYLLEKMLPLYTKERLAEYRANAFLPGFSLRK